MIKLVDHAAVACASSQEWPIAARRGRRPRAERGARELRRRVHSRTKKMNLDERVRTAAETYSLPATPLAKRAIQATSC